MFSNNQNERGIKLYIVKAISLFREKLKQEYSEKLFTEIRTDFSLIMELVNNYKHQSDIDNKDERDAFTASYDHHIIHCHSEIINFLLKELQRNNQSSHIVDYLKIIVGINLRVARCQHNPIRQLYEELMTGVTTFRSSLEEYCGKTPVQMKEEIIDNQDDKLDGLILVRQLQAYPETSRLDCIRAIKNLRTVVNDFKIVLNILFLLEKNHRVKCLNLIGDITYLIKNDHQLQSIIALLPVNECPSYLRLLKNNNQLQPLKPLSNIRIFDKSRKTEVEMISTNKSKRM